jgi:hypothetical protein
MSACWRGVENSVRRANVECLEVGGMGLEAVQSATTEILSFAQNDDVFFSGWARPIERGPLRVRE